jgi:hypothetical protein
MAAITVQLNEEDLWFITESISCNVPSSDDMTHEQKKTFRKMQRAETRMYRKTRTKSKEASE